MPLYMVGCREVSAREATFSEKFATKYSYPQPCRARCGGRMARFFLRPMLSHNIPMTTDEDGNTTRGTKRPRTQKQPKSGFIQAVAFIQNEEIRRASEQTSPQVARAVGHPAKAGRGRRFDQWQQIKPPFSCLTDLIRPVHRILSGGKGEGPQAGGTQVQR